MNSMADDKDDAHMRDDTESAYVKIFTIDIVTLKNNTGVCVWGGVGGGYHHERKKTKKHEG